MQLNRQAKRRAIFLKIKAAYNKADPVWVLVIAYALTIGLLLFAVLIAAQHKNFHH